MMMANDSFKRRRLLSCSSSSAEIVGHSEELATQISLHLPVKSILRFLSVSKQWKSLLTHPRFVHGYSSLHMGRNSLLFYGDDIFYLSVNDHNFDIADFGYLSIPSGHCLHLERSCNGLLLFSTTSHTEGGILDTSYYYVCNPFTRKYRELVVPYHTAGVQPISSYLAFDPCTSPYYKVILISISSDNIKTYHFSIYSSETENWRKLDQTLKHPHSHFGSSLGNFFNGAIFWLESLRLITSSYFHINQESVNTVVGLPYPSLSSRPGRYNTMKDFGGFGGNLYLVFTDPRDSIVDVHVLNEDFSSWIDKFKVDFDAIACEHPQIIKRNQKNEKLYEYSLVCILDKEEEASIVICIGNELIAYNFIDKTTKKLCNIKTDRQRMKAAVSCCGSVCTESLFGV